jgi:uncharacterized protein
MSKNGPGQKWRSYLKWIGGVLLVQFILINISAALYAYKFTHFYKQSSASTQWPEKNIFAKTWHFFSGPRYPKPLITETPRFPFDTVLLRTSKGTLIDCWYGKADSVFNGTVILFHREGVTKSTVLDEADEFRYFGYNVMLVDLRGHGNSAGRTITLGYREAEEVKLAWDHIKAKGERNIFLWGSSAGAVAITKAIADHGLQPAGVMLEMPFQSLQTRIQEAAREVGFQGFPEKPFGFLISWWIGTQQHFSGHRYKTTSYVKKMNCPVLLQWGIKDVVVTRKETEKVYEAIASSNKKLVIYDRAGHGSLLQSDPIKWRIETERLLSMNRK